MSSNQKGIYDFVYLVKFSEAAVDADADGLEMVDAVVDVPFDASANENSLDLGEALAKLPISRS